MPASFALTYPRSEGKSEVIELVVGQILFVLGANGAGKSGLMHFFFKGHKNDAHRILSHRQTWFQTNSLDLTGQQRLQLETSLNSRDAQSESRWKDDHSTQRPGIALFDLIDSQNTRARDIADAVDKQDFKLAKELSMKDAPIKIINEILRLSNIPIEISVRQNDQIWASKNGGSEYSVAQLSDGERNALLIAATVLTAKAGSLFVIDEPERHLHRSIISPLLTLLFAQRADCAFIVSTHELMLPLDNPAARTLLVRGCTYSGTVPTAWDTDILQPNSDFPDDMKQDILGARRKAL